MDKKQEILKAAFDIFCEKGYHLSVAEIAGAVKIKAPSLYSHFGSKDEIIEQVVRDEIQNYFSSLTEKMSALEDLDCHEALQALFDFVIGYFSKENRLRFWRAIPFIPNYQLNRVCAQLISENDAIFEQQLQKYFLAGQANGEIRPDAPPGAIRLYLCLIQGVLDWMLLQPTELDDSLDSAELFAAYWYGLSLPQDQKEGSDHEL